MPSLRRRTVGCTHRMRWRRHIMLHQPSNLWKGTTPHYVIMNLLTSCMCRIVYTFITLFFSRRVVAVSIAQKCQHARAHWSWNSVLPTAYFPSNCTVNTPHIFRRVICDRKIRQCAHPHTHDAQTQPSSIMFQLDISRHFISCDIYIPASSSSLWSLNFAHLNFSPL